MFDLNFHFQNVSVVPSTIDWTDCVIAIAAMFGMFISVFTLILLCRNLIELQIQNKSIKSSLDISQKQIQEIQKQNFETRLFNLLKRQNEIPESVLGKDTARNDTFRQIRNEFTYLYFKLYVSKNDNSEHVNNIILKIPSKYRLRLELEFRKKAQKLQEKMEEKKIENNNKNDDKIDEELLYLRFCYLEIFSAHKSLLSPYFRHLYHILKQIYKKNNKINKNSSTPPCKNDASKRAKTYTDIIQAGMTNDELFMTYYNSLCFPKAQSLLADYNFFQNMGQDELLNPKHILFMKHINSEFEVKDKIDLIFPKNDPLAGIDFEKISQEKLTTNASTPSVSHPQHSGRAGC